MTGHFIKYTSLVQGWTHFSFRAVLILFNKVLETFLGFWSILTWQSYVFAADLSYAQPWCEFAPDFEGAPLDWDLMTLVAIWVQWTDCQVHDWSFVTYCVILLGAGYQENIRHTITPLPAWSSDIRQRGSILSFYLCQIVTIPSKLLGETYTHWTRQHFSILWCLTLVSLCKL